MPESSGPSGVTWEPRLYELGAVLTGAVRDAPNQQLTGAVLGQHAHRHNPGLLQSANLKLAEVLDRYAPELNVVGRQGLDLIWGLGLSDDEPDIDPAESPAAPPSEHQSSPEGVVWKSLWVENYRSLRKVKFDFDDLTVLVGRNGVGKSNLLDAIFRTSLLTRRKPLSVFRNRHSLERVVGKWAPRVGFQLQAVGSDGWGFTYHSDNPFEPPRRPPFSVRMGPQGQSERQSLAFTPLADVCGGATYLHLNAARLWETTWLTHERPFLRHDGLYLGSVLAYIAQMDRERLSRIVESVQKLVPRVQDVRTPPRRLIDDGIERLGHYVEVKMGGVGWMPADQLSEGTLLALGLHTVLSRPEPPRVLLLDDIDRGLHPAAQRALVTQLQHLASPACRIVCTSHSPYVLDPLPPSAVRVVTQNQEGATQVHRLVDHPQWTEWADGMNAAEFWQYVGDDVWPVEATP